MEVDTKQNEYMRKKQRSFRVSPVLISIIFIVTFMFCVCYFVVGFDIILKITVGLCLVLIEYWYYTLLLLTFFTGFYFLASLRFDDEENKCGLILIWGSVIIFIILVIGGTAQDIIKSKEEKMYQEQSQMEIIQPEKNEKVR